MAENSKIEWTHHTFNPWIGCQRVSPGCEHCYAEAMVKRAPGLVYGPGGGYLRASRDVAQPDSTQGLIAGYTKIARLPVWGPQAPRRATSADYWRQPFRWNREAQEAGERRRVFCASMADVFEDWHGVVSGDFARLDEVRVGLWALIEQTPHLDWLLLTKRPENVLRMVPAAWLERWPRNAWIGATMEDQKRANERAEYLLRIPAPVRFVSYEPALEAVDFRPWLPHCAKHGLRAPCCGKYTMRPGIDWLICGGESGPGARPLDLAWVRSARDQCRAAGVPVFVKQFGALPHLGDCRTAEGDELDRQGRLRGDFLGRPASARIVMRDRKGADPAEWPADLRVREFPR